ncbi:MAG: ABC transporter permease [Gemmataceae bacterium]|nr:ABC transporter permease [Gemmataceae bacterium]
MHVTVYRLLSLRYLQVHWERGLLIVASIALGVATLISARILNQCIEAAAQDTTTPVDAAALYVSNGEAGVMRRLVSEIRAARIPGLKAVEPLIYERVTLPDLENRSAVLLGAEVSSQMLSRDNPLKVQVTPLADLPRWQLMPILAAVQQGDLTRAAELWDRLPGRLAVVSRSLYEAWAAHGKQGQPLRVRYALRDLDCLVVGIVDFAADSPLSSLGTNLIGMSVGQAARMLRPVPPLAALAGSAAHYHLEQNWEEKINRIDLFIEAGADVEAIERAVNAIVAGRAAVRTPDAQRQSTQEVVGGLQLAFYICALGSMIVGLFLVYNAMVVTVAERQADIGILRSLGATRWQIAGLFTLLAAVLGLVGAVAGIPLGIMLAETAFWQFREELASMFLNPEVKPQRLDWRHAVWAVAAGVSVALLAALIPTLQAVHEDPARAVRRGLLQRRKIWQWLHYATCLLLIGGGLSVILLRHYLPSTRSGSIGGMAAILVGLLLATPLFVSWSVPLLCPLVQLGCPFVVRLAFDNLTRAPGRTGIVLGALAAGVALMFQTAGVGRSNEEPVIAWIDQVVQADYFVFNGNMMSANTSNSPMSAEVVTELRQLPGVDHVMAIRYSRPEYNNTIVYLLAVDAEDYVCATRQRIPVGLPDLEKFLDLPGSNDVLVSENFARRHQVRAGDLIRLPGPQGSLSFRVIGTVRDYSWSRGTVFMDRRRYAELFGDHLIDMCHVFLRPDHTGQQAGTAALQEYVQQRGLFLTDRHSLRHFLTELIQRLYLFAYAQQVVVGIVAALGVVTALLISVLQRRRELGLLLAVGATPFQVLASVLAEATLLGILGTILGFLIGFPLEWYILHVIMVEESGFVFDAVIPWRQAGGIAAVAVGSAILAGLWPAWRAVRTRIPEVLQYE